MTRPRLYDHDEIRRLHAEGMNGYQIAKQLGCDIKLPYYVLNQSDPPYYETHDHRYQVLLDYRERHRKEREPYPYNREMVVEAVKRFIDWHERIPRERDWGTEGLPPLAAARYHGGIIAMIEAAGYQWHRKPKNPGTGGRRRKPDFPPCGYSGCNRKGMYTFSDFAANEAQALCGEHYRLKLAVLGGVVH